MNQCLFCGHVVTLIHVHGHYQCPVCHTNALPCCDGDNCHTNALFQEPAANGSKPLTTDPSAQNHKTIYP